METSDLPKKTPKNLTNNKLPDSDEEHAERKESSPDDDIDDETHNPKEGDPFDKTNDQVLIEDFYDENQSEKERQEAIPTSENGDDQLDMDYSQSQLDDFLKSQSNRGLSSQQLLHSFVSTYNKTKSLNRRAATGSHSKNMNSIASAAKISPEEPIDEKLEEGQEEESENQLALKPEPEENKAPALDSDDDMARTPDVINLSEVTANDDGQ
jgi:hypothetical protein